MDSSVNNRDKISPKTLSELWNILPYAGLWYVNGNCGLVSDFPTPPEKNTYMLGTPYSGDNSGKNPNLRLISFISSTAKGPILSTGPQTIFFNNFLIYTIKWKIEPIGTDINEVNIGFYSSNYLSRNLGTNVMIPMISRLGPTFYKSTSNRRKGKFVITWFDDMYVVVDANVSVKLWVTFEVPETFTIPCFNKLFKAYKYCVNNDCNGKELAATEQLVNQETLQTLLRPVNKYIKLSQEMIAYLSSKSVKVTMFNNDTTNVKLANLKQEYLTVPFKLFKHNSDFGYVKLMYYQLDTTGLTSATGGGQSFYLYKSTNSMLTVTFNLIIVTPPLNYNEPSYRSEFSVILGQNGGTRWQESQDKEPFKCGPFLPNETYNVPVKFIGSASENNISIRIMESLYYSAPNEGNFSASIFKITANYFTITLHN